VFDSTGAKGKQINIDPGEKSPSNPQGYTCASTLAGNRFVFLMGDEISCIDLGN